MQWHPFANIERAALWHLTQHYVDSPMEAVGAMELHIEENVPEEDDFAISERLVGVFARMYAYEERVIPANCRPSRGIWDMMRHDLHRDIYKLLFDRDVEGLASYLCNGLRDKVSIGLGLGSSVYRAFADDYEGRTESNVLIRDRLASLAEALGTLSCENPEQGRGYGTNVGTRLESLLSSLEYDLGTDICRPPVMGIFGIKAGDRKVIDPTLPEDVYAAHRLKTLIAERQLSHVAEIGGGFGGTAFQFIRSGGDTYSIFDQPLICLLQGFFLMKIFGGDDIKFFGEDLPDRRINILPYWEFFDRGRKLDLILNRGSLTDMPRHSAVEYLIEIAQRNATLLSINQEGEAEAGNSTMRQPRVSSLAANISALIRTSRFPYWIKRGFVEEVYQPRP